MNDQEYPFMIYSHVSAHKPGCPGNILYGFNDIEDLNAHEARVLEICSGCNDEL